MNLLPVNCQLADTPKEPPTYAVKVKNAAGKEETLGDPRATRALLALMNQHAVIGGAASHWGGPSAFAEIMSSLHAIMFRTPKWFDHYNFVNDAGHTENGVYALRANYRFADMDFSSLRFFRSIESPLTGHGEVHVNPQGVLISNGPLGSGLPQAQGLALADGISGKARTTVCTISDGGCMEGEAREALAAIPGLAARGCLAPFVLLVSDNNTKLSGRIDQDSFSMVPTFESLTALGWQLVNVKDGHDLEKVHIEIDKAMAVAKENPRRPLALVFKTIKGKGVKATEEAKSGGHGYPVKAGDPALVDFIQEIYAGEAPEYFIDWAKELITTPKKATSSGVKKEKVQAGMSRAAIKAAKEGLPVFSLSADLQGSTGMGAFHKSFPDKSLDLGVAEANMVSSAIGLSKAGFIPIVDTFAQFGITKGNLPLIMSALSEGPLIALFSHSGFQDAADGASHQATTCFSAVGSIPHTTVINCSCSDQAQALLYQSIKRFEEARRKGEVPASTIFFQGRENFPPCYKEGGEYIWGKAQVLQEGGDVVIVASGSMVAKALQVKDINATVIDSPFINRPDTKTIGEYLNKCGGKLIVIEDHQVIGGQGALLSHALLRDGYNFSFRSVAIPETFARSAYQADHLYDKYGINAAGIVAAFNSF